MNAADIAASMHAQSCRAQDTYMPVRNSAARDKIFPNICSEFWELEGGGGRGGCVMRTLMRAMSASAGREQSAGMSR